MRYPALRHTIAKLAEDHQLVALLLGQLEQALDRSVPASELMSHVDGIAPIMESHFRYEERELPDVPAELDPDADPHTMFGPL
ncbi:hypothetical protein ACFS2C_09610 [Prauserella oleivorans]|uniref:Hemerythrin-like domain-containing protein n=1 Tax=Prauserella oleivorans TaxID=1478153 RepID=A0ABW5W8Z1_9PSEU